MEVAITQVRMVETGSSEPSSRKSSSNKRHLLIIASAEIQHCKVSSGKVQTRSGRTFLVLHVASANDKHDSLDVLPTSGIIGMGSRVGAEHFHHGLVSAIRFTGDPLKRQKTT